jgi:hypothetical protein
MGKIVHKGRHMQVISSITSRDGLNNREQKPFLQLRHPGRQLRTPYTTVLHDPILWPYIWVTINGEIRAYTDKNGARRRLYTVTGIYDRNTVSCKSSYFSISVRLQLCMFDLGLHNALFGVSKC